MIAFVLYVVLMLGLMCFLLALASRFVRAHERGAGALERIASRLASNGTARGPEA